MAHSPFRTTTVVLALVLPAPLRAQDDELAKAAAAKASEQLAAIQKKLAAGSETSIPRLIMGAVTMKTSSSTSTTSTSGVTLISPRAAVPLRDRSPR